MNLNNLIKRVESTRPERLDKKRKGLEFQGMNLAEKENRLRMFHPSYKESSLRELKVGPSKGYSIASEICEILESWSRVDPDRIDLTKIGLETDVLIIGGGGAGTAAALLAQENGAKVTMATKLRHGDANTTMMSEGGIQIASQPGKDSSYYHYLDTTGGGHFANVPQLVYTLVTQAPSVLQWLEGLGAMFDKNPDGSYRVFHLGGPCRKRVHVASDITGAEIMRTLRDEARNRKEIVVLEFMPAVELVLSEKGHCEGAILHNLDTEEYFFVKAKAVILATGGSGRLHIGGFMTTNPYGATGDGLVLGYRAGIGFFFTRLNTTRQERSTQNRLRGFSFLKSLGEQEPIFLILMENSLFSNESQGMPVHHPSLRNVLRWERGFPPQPERLAFGSILQ